MSLMGQCLLLCHLKRVESGPRAGGGGKGKQSVEAPGDKILVMKGLFGSQER